MKMFNLIDIGERAGSGLSNIYKVWEQEGYSIPEIQEDFEPERIALSLKTEKNQR